MSALPTGAAVTVNFHPDLRTPAGGEVLSELVRTGRYFPQWVTHISNGAVSHETGGERWQRESEMFGGVYDESAPHERPVYGALNVLNLSGGAAPRYGSCFLRLTADVLDRTTFCYPDSMFPPVELCTKDSFALTAPLLTAIRAHPHCCADYIDYVEAQVHGGVTIAQDVAAVVLDPSFRGTDVERTACELGCAVEWHPGFRAEIGLLSEHTEYRGERYTAIARRVCGREAVLTPGLIGRAREDYSRFDLERVWHMLAWFGRPREDQQILRQVAEQRHSA